MAATLPPINGQGGMRKVPSYAENLPQGSSSAKLKASSSGKLGSPQGTPNGRLSPLRGGNRKEKDLQEKRLKLRALQQDLSKVETAVYRHSYRHTLCLEMLKEGFHLSFRELFNLIHQQLEERQRRGPESLMWTQIMLENEHEKLDMLRRHLTKAETAQRNEDFQEVYRCRHELAKYFQNTEDKWLADHFFQTCLEMSDSIDTDDGKTKALSRCLVGLSLEENGENFEAAEHFEAYYTLSKDHPEDWLKEEDEGEKISFYTDACVCLYRIYSTIGNKLEEQDPEKSIEYLIQAFDKAKESNDVKLRGEAAYRLGLAYEKSGNTKTALLHLNSFYAACQQSNDKEGLGRACDAIAKAYARQGNKEQSIHFLKEFVQVAEETGMDDELSLACHNLGNIFNSLGRYREAGEYFNRAYNISRAIGEGPPIQINRVQSGIAQAHAMLKAFSAHVVRGDTPCLKRIIEWKSVRQSAFHEDILEPAPAPAAEVASATQAALPSSVTEEEQEDNNQNAEEQTTQAPADDQVNEASETRETTEDEQ